MLLTDELPQELAPIPPGSSAEIFQAGPPPIVPAIPPPVEAPPVPVVSSHGERSELPLAQRFRPEMLRRQWWLDMRHDAPCWLTSMLVHATLIVLLGLFVAANHRQRIMSPLVLTASLVSTDQEDETNIGDVAIELTTSHEDDLAAIEDDAPPKNDPPPAMKTDAAKERAALSRPAIAAVMHVPVRLASDWFRAKTPTSTSADDVNSADAEYDEIVEQFIQYDIGRLKGEAAQRAVRRFQRLGPDAIPALVRGLNRSAYIAASCPVGVISSKLTMALAESDDPGALEYALENIGRDVPPGAPHRARILSLRDGLAQMIEQRRESARLAARKREEHRTNLEDRIRAAGVMPTDELVEQYEMLGGRGPEELIVAAQSSEAARRTAAAIAAGDRNWHLRPAERLRLGRTMTNLLDTDNDEVRAVAHRALIRLADGTNAGPAVGSRREAYRQAVPKWGTFWNEYDEQYIGGRLVMNRVHLADTLARRGRRDAAIERYRAIVSEHPGTVPARIAAERLEELQSSRRGAGSAEE